MAAHDRLGKTLGGHVLEDVAAVDEVSSWYGARAHGEKQTERKTVRVLDVTGGDVEARFLAWRSFVRLLDHRAIPRGLHAGTSGEGEAFHLLEAIEGAPLRPILDVTLAGAVVLDVLDALSVCHAAGSLFYALLPERIFLGDGVRLLDTGLFEILGDDARASAISARAGFVAPEVVTASWSELDTRADVYAAGALLCALLTGHPPLDPANIAFELPASVASVVSRALSFEPRQRHRSALEMKDELRVALKPN